MSRLLSTAVLAPGLHEKVESWTAGVAALSRIALSERGTSTTLQTSADHLYIALQVLGRSAFVSRKRLCYLSAGSWAYWNPDRAHLLHLYPRSVRSKVLLLEVPRTRPADCAGEGECIVPHVNCVLSNTMRAFMTARAPFDPALSADIGSLLIKVAECAIEEHRSAQRAATSIYADRLDRVRRYILTRLHEPQLSLDDIAAHVGYSKRYVHKLFSAYGERAGHFILRMRLQAAHCKLLSPNLASQPITSIALSHGFSDPSHFSEVYRLRFGVRPSVVRRACHFARRRLD